MDSIHEPGRGLFTRSAARRYVAAFAAAVVVATVVAQPGPVQAADSGAPTVERLAGGSRFETAIAVSQDSFPQGAPAVVIARGDDYADALAGGPLAAQLGGPILLATRDGLPSEVADEIRRLGASHVALLGGTSALSAQVEADLRGLGVKSIDRYAGPDRFETSRLIAEQVLRRSGQNQAYLALGGHRDQAKGWPDAVAVSALAASTGRPILLTSGTQIPKSTRSLIAGGALRAVAVVGGTAAIPAGIDDELLGMGLAVSRLAGPTRYHTSVVVTESALAQGASSSPTWIVTGNNYPDALTAGPAVAASGGVALLVDSASWQQNVARNWLAAHVPQVRQLMIVGGHNAISSGLEQDARALLGADPIAGIAGAFGGTRLGLHVSAGELAVWRLRAKAGPYRVAGDAGKNTPGDWARISSEAASFKSNPAQAVWAGPTVLDSAGCVMHVSGPTNNNNPPREGPSRLRDAAFYYLITGDASYRTPVKAKLLEQAAKPGVDFSDRSRWCPFPSMADGSPTFDIANWLTQLVYAYDYLGPDSFTAAERAKLNRWFYEAATFWAEYTNPHLDRLFADRWNGDYTLTSLGNSDKNPRVGYYGGKPTYQIHRFYNNRVAARYRFVAAAAVKLADEGYGANDAGAKLSLGELRKSSKLFVKEWLAYSVFPEGFFGEFERWTSTNPDYGLKYAGEVLGPVVTIADLFARAGDPELIGYSTTAGAKGTQSATPKTLRFAIESLGRHVDGTYKRYATDQASRNGDPAYRIDGVNGAWHTIYDIHMAPLNRYYNSAYITGLYTRTGTGLTGYPTKPAASHYTVWRGDWGTLPGLLFMHGGLG